MAQASLQGLWKLVNITNSPLTGHETDVVLHFVDDRYFYDLSGGWLTRHRYHSNPDADPAEIDFGHSLGIYSENGRLLRICRAAPGEPRPASFEKASVSEYEYVGEGPTDWRTKYKQQLRLQLEETA